MKISREPFTLSFRLYSNSQTKATPMKQAKQELLVLSAQQGNTKAFNALVEHYHSALVKFAYRICANQQLAQDAVQEAWLKLSQQLRKLNDPRAFKSWIYRAVRWRCIDLMRRQNNNEQELTDYQQQFSDSMTETPSVSEGSLLPYINQLPDVEKQIIYLFYLNEISITEIAIILEIPIGTVKSRLNRARNQLRNIIPRDEL
ncbi:MAG: sigma-70 family RNA polymerase sigma factor [Kangiellaceae bacterium]|nr:sigma-70 family RNA polymerase sigma factor [Kangiellaceae bacterium]